MEKIATKNTPLDTSSCFAENMNHLCRGESQRRFCSYLSLTVNIFLLLLVVVVAVLVIV